MKKTSKYLKQKKVNGEKITMLTCYDYPTALLEDEVGIDIIFVGDSVGTNILGYKSEKEVTMEDMIHHLRAVHRGITDAYLLVDMPYKSCETPSQALKNAQIFISYGANGVKIEGFKPEVVRQLADNGIEVCSHLGLTPQLDDHPGYKAKTALAASELVKNAFEMENAGATFALFETIPEQVAKYLSEKLQIPTIGIGAGRFTDGQVLVIVDILGISPFEFRHNKKYNNFREQALLSIKNYADDVKQGLFPKEENLRVMNPSEFKEFMTIMNDSQR